MVLGLGVSGRAAARFLAARGASLVMVDRRVDLPADNLPSGELHLGVEDPQLLERVALVVTSPGISPSAPMLETARQRRIPIIGELELGYGFVDAPIVAVTGTNGKSTVTALIGEIFQTAGLRAFVGGNFGTPLVEAVGQQWDVLVVEVSSYQLETVVEFRPRCAIHLNLTDDHLDRYDSLNDYGAAKARIFENQTPEDWAIINRDDPQVLKLAPQLRARVFSFGDKRPDCLPAVWCANDSINFDLAGLMGSVSLHSFQLSGGHNRLNAAAAIAAALAMGVVPGTIELALGKFRGLPHRLELVRERQGVRYIDDSKATNVGAVVEALAATPGPIVLIAGGVDKGGSYEPLRVPLHEKAVMLILLGAARTTLSQALDGVAEIRCVNTMADAVRLAAAHAPGGGTVLLSPACSSFDQFKDYAERGRVFQELVRAL